MPGPVIVVDQSPTSCTSAALSYETHLRREIAYLQASEAQDARMVLTRLLSGDTSGRSSSPVFRAMRDAVQTRVASHTGEEAAVYDVALAALDTFVAVRLRGARSKASAFFDQLCRDRAWNSLALFSASSVAEAAFLAVNETRKRLTIIDTAPRYEGRGVAKRLAAATGVPVKYGMLSNCQRLLEGVDAVLIGAEEVAMNGAVVAAPGTSVVVHMARELGVVVIVATQAVKFSENMIVDWTHGEYDVIRPSEVMSIVTEMDTGQWNPASAPDVLRGLQCAPSF